MAQHASRLTLVKSGSYRMMGRGRQDGSFHSTTSPRRGKDCWPFAVQVPTGSSLQFPVPLISRLCYPVSHSSSLATIAPKARKCVCWQSAYNPPHISEALQCPKALPLPTLLPLVSLTKCRQTHFRPVG